MNGLQLLKQLGVKQEFIQVPGEWEALTTDAAFRRIVNTPLQQLVQVNETSGVPLPSLNHGSGVVRGTFLVEVISYRDVSKPLPLEKDFEESGEEAVPQFTATRTLKMLLTDGSSNAQTLVGMEYETCPQLDTMRLGAKLQLKDVFYHMGVLLLTPSNTRLVGSPDVAVTQAG